jgi:hypothetical protein
MPDYHSFPQAMHLPGLPGQVQAEVRTAEGVATHWAAMLHGGLLQHSQKTFFTGH